MSIPEAQTPSSHSTVVTLFRGGRWMNAVRGADPLPGSFRSRDAAVAVGRAYAAKARAAHVIEDPNGSLAARPAEARTDADEIVSTDPATAARVRQHERFESAMAEKDLLEEDHSVRLEPQAVRHEEPTGTEQSAG